MTDVFVDPGDYGYFHHYPRGRVRCPQCGIRGSIHTQRGFRVEVRHECPGPWVLERVVPTDNPRTSPWRATFVNVPFGLFGEAGHR